MKRTDAAHHVGNLFQSGNPLTGQRGTRLDHTWLNAVQEELAAVIEAAGIVLDGADSAQLLTALSLLAEASFDSLADAQAAVDGPRAPTGSIIRTKGYAAPGDGGHALFLVAGDDTAGTHPQASRLTPLAAYDPRVFGATASAIGDALRVSNRAALPGLDLTATSPVVLDDGQSLRGANLRKSRIVNESSTAVLNLPGNSGHSKDIGIDLRDFSIVTEDYGVGTGVGIDSHNQGYPFLDSVEVRGGLSAAVRLRSTVGLTALNTIFGYSRRALDIDNEAGGVEGNTYTRMFASAFRISDTGIHHKGITRGIQLFAPLFEGLGAMVTREDEDSWINNFVAYGGWAEGIRDGQVAYDETGHNYQSGSLAQERRLEGCNVPVIDGMYWAGQNTLKGSFYPKLTNQHLTPQGVIGEFLFRDQHTDKQFDFSGTVTNWGGKNTYGIRGTLPKLGDWASPDEKYYRQGVFGSIGAANVAGIYEGSSNPCANLLDTPPTQLGYVAPAGTVYWPFRADRGGAISVIPGWADPYGGTDAVLIHQGTAGTNDIPAFANGGKWMTLILVARAQVAGDVLRLVMNSTGGAILQAKNLELEMTDTEWRLYHAHIYLQPNAGANYRIAMGSSGGGVIVARAACFEGADLHPPLAYGQRVPSGFRFLHGQIETVGDAAPATGTWRVGDRVRYRTPTAGGRVGAVCTSAGTPGIWKSYGNIAA